MKNKEFYTCWLLEINNNSIPYIKKYHFKYDIKHSDLERFLKNTIIKEDFYYDEQGHFYRKNDFSKEIKNNTVYLNSFPLITLEYFIERYDLDKCDNYEYLINILDKWKIK